MSDCKPVRADEVAENKRKSFYPEPFAALTEGRSKRRLGDHFGLEDFGVNLTRLTPGAMSALKHRHSRQDEFIYILSGPPTLVYGDAEFPMTPGEGFGCKRNNRVAHHVVNRSGGDTVYLEIGDRTAGTRSGIRTTISPRSRGTTVPGRTAHPVEPVFLPAGSSGRAYRNYTQ